MRRYNLEVWAKYIELTPSKKQNADGVGSSTADEQTPLVLKIFHESQTDSSWDSWTKAFPNYSFGIPTWQGGTRCRFDTDAVKFKCPNCDNGDLFWRCESCRIAVRNYTCSSCNFQGP